MAEEKTKPALPKEVIAMPPLRMVLVHAKNETVNKSGTISDLRDTAGFTEEQNQEDIVQPESLKKLIKHLEKKPK
jgi:hypothetical protein